MRARLCTTGLVLLALVACEHSEKAGQAPTKCEGDSDCAKGFLCESKTCVPKAVAEKARTADELAEIVAKQAASAAPAPAPTPEPKAAAPDAAVEDEGPIPVIPSEPSDPPKGTEWKEGKRVNTQHAASQPDKCEMRVLREWLQVTCLEEYAGYEKMENFGRKHVDYFQSIEPWRVVSFVLRMKKGRTQAVRICGRDKRASLFVSWPASAERPKHIALGKGPRCDGSEWGDFMKKEEKKKRR